MDSSDEAIRRLTQIEERRFPAKGEEPSDMGAKAVKLALRSARMTSAKQRSRIGGLYAGTIDRDFGSIMPDIAVAIQHKAMLPKAIEAYDVGGACTGGLLALRRAMNLTQVEQVPTIAVGMGYMHEIVNYGDRRSAILFGNGAGAFAIDNHPGGDVLRPTFWSSSEYDRDAIYVRGVREAPANDDDTPPGKMKMDGHRVADHAKLMLKEAAEEVAKKAGLFDEDTERIKLDEFDGIFIHQANGNLIDAFAESIGAPEGKVYSCVAEDGNTAAASIPLAMEHAIRHGELDPTKRSTLLTVAVGAGMVATAGIFEFQLGTS